MKDAFKVTEWFEAQVGRGKASVIADAEAKAAETKNAIILAQRERVNLQTRAVVSMISRADSRVRYFLTFTGTLDKRPIGVTASDWVLYRAIVAGWVDAGEASSDVLCVFDGK